MTAPPENPAPPLSLEEVGLTFKPGQGLFQELADGMRRLIGRSAARGGVQAVRGVSLALRPGEVLALVGESGSGMSTLGRIMDGLYRPETGRVLWDGQNLAWLDRAARRLFRRRVQIIFQDPVSSLNPRFTAGATVEEGLIIHRLGSAAERQARVTDLLREVGLPADSARHFSHEFSGGQRQRLSLARALALDPEVLIADEPVSALDVSIQAQVINLLLDLRSRRGLTLVLISHDLPLVRLVADRLAVMYGGRLMEVAAVETLGKDRHHPYVEALWASASGGNPLEGHPPDPGHPPPGCPFAPRCREADENCLAEPSPLIQWRPDFACACRHRQSP
jgi:oligopeptide/dipeptide ABC transporter ATP-binding protein